MVFNNSILAGASGQGGAVESFRFYKLAVTAVNGLTNFALANIQVNIGGTGQFPEMTADNAPSPNVITTSGSTVSTNFPFHVRDDDLNNLWACAQASPTFWQLDLGSGNTINKPDELLLKNHPGNTLSPRDFTLQASNDGSSFDILLTVTGNTFSSGSQTKTFTIP